MFELLSNPTFQWLSTLIGFVWLTKLILTQSVQLGTAIWIYLFVPIFGKKQNWKKNYGEWAVVTGATDGIGKEFARQLASQGMNIILISRTQSRLDATASEIVKDFSVRTKVISIDYMQATIATYRKLEDELSKYEVGILVNNVGMFMDYPMPMGQMSFEDIWGQVVVNTGAPSLMSKIILPQMKERGKGGIINISSGAATVPMPLMTTYSASKVYVDYLSEGMRTEYGRHGIKVLNLNTHGVATKMSQTAFDMTQSLFVATPEKYVKSALRCFGRVNSSTGYWTHAIEGSFMGLIPGFLVQNMIYDFNKDFQMKGEKKKGQ